MAGRPTKQGIDYFPMDVGIFTDVKIRKISRACGSQSTSLLICLLCNIYKDEGYYIFDDKYLILGNLKYEMEKKEYTFSKNVMLIDNQTETGRTWIKEYIERFEDTKKNYETSVMQYCDTES